MGDDRSHQRPAAAIGDLHGVAQIAIAHDRGHGAKGLGIVDAFRLVRVGAVEQHRRQKGALGPVRAMHLEVVGIAKDPLGLCPDHLGLFQHVAFLAVGHQRAHAGALVPRIADRRLGQLRAQRLDHRGDLALGRDDAADRGAFLPRLHGHLAMHFLDEEIELGRTRLRIGPQDRGVQAVLLGHETHRLLQDMRVRPQLERRIRRTGKAHRVLAGQPVQHVAQATGHELQRALGQQTAFQHQPHRQFGDVTGGRRRFHDRGHPRQQGRPQLFQHPPDREVEGVDMHSDALQRRTDVMAQELA